MVILGINGLLHDASVCLIKDGQVLSAMEHERISRFKNAYLLFPIETVQVMLKELGISREEIDYVVWNYDFRRFHISGFAYYIRSIRRTSEIFPLLYHYLINFIYKIHQHILMRFMTKVLFMGTRCPKMLFAPHHLAHFLYSYFASSYTECASLIVDGAGEYSCTTCLYYKDSKLKIISTQGLPTDSLGILYSIGTFYLGFKPLADEYKVMGLASYGRPNAKYKQFFEQLVKLKKNGRYTIDRNLISYHKDMMHTFTEKALAMLGPFCKDSGWSAGEISQDKKDFAFALQKRLEETVLHIIRYLKQEVDSENLVLGGGVFLNASLNGVVKRSKLFRNVFIPPAPHDAGTAIGAAIYGYMRNHHNCDRDRLGFTSHTYLGSEFNDEQIEEELKRSKLKYKKLENPDQIIEETISALCSGKIVGWFQGRMEFGPRALGNRSILADPRSVEMKANLNSAIKNREGFRPFAPSVLEEKMTEVFENECFTPFMVVVDLIREEMRAKIPAVTHVDGTGRPQSVNRSQNQLYYDLIHAFYEITGVPLLLNTSFNYRDEPLVRTPQEAIRCFCGTGIDIVVIASFWLEK